MIRGNHEAADINALFGFRIECIERLVFFLIRFFKKKNNVDDIAAIHVYSLFKRVSEMVFGLGIGSTDYLIGFL